ncbi:MULTISPECIES: E3 binding domain-containing protein [Rhodococcus]|uniref:E3 binding domain-containing protein n=1 Tax=Rhodococcus TaxID=1827 RepID=UPI0012065890|nr:MULTISPECIES: E3 binding domain-containing protein [Rhodococcus]QXW01289.1 E3 binding domain-containing protein [Rhodococcus globerulus]RZL24617.1 MAG: hypothetical protein EOP31_14310 [Rhodococcus sp. (in: high G+C Gram-positive bacteria)]
MNQTLDQHRVKASPLARRLASIAGLDIGTVYGTGPGGRIVRRDVEAMMSVSISASTLASDDEEMLGHRRTDIVAKQDVCVSQLVDLHRTVNAGRDRPISMTTLVAKAAILAFRNSPLPPPPGKTETQSASVRTCKVAFFTPREGTQIIDSSADYPLSFSGDAIGIDAGSACTGSGLPDGVSVFVADLGDAGVTEYCYPRPESVVLSLAIGRVEERVVAANGGIGIRKMLTCTANADGRVVSVLAVCTWLRDLQHHLEQPATSLL